MARRESRPGRTGRKYGEPGYTHCVGKLVSDRKFRLNPGRQPVVDDATRAEIERKLAAPPTDRPLIELLEELWASVPEDEWDSIPRDLGVNHDHYLYGAPKVKE